MGITSHTHMHAQQHTYTQRNIFFLWLHSEEKWMDLTGRRRTQWRRRTHASCFISSHSSLSAIFFRSLPDFMTHSVSVGGNNVVPVTPCFSCPPELTLNTQSSIPDPVGSSFFHELWSEFIHIQTATWAADHFTQTVSPSEGLLLVLFLLLLLLLLPVFVQVRAPN